jgi:hypothetical protein
MSWIFLAVTVYPDGGGDDGKNGVLDGAWIHFTAM